MFKNFSKVLILLISIMVATTLFFFVPANEIPAEAEVEPTIEKSLKETQKTLITIPKENISNQHSSVCKDEFIVVRDEKNNMYYYASNTGMLCGFQKEFYYGFHEENPVPEEYAIQIAEQYLNKIISDFGRYTRTYITHSEDDAVYHLQYSHQINGIITDDLIRVCVQENGEIGSFMIPHYGQYKKVTIDKEMVLNAQMAHPEDRLYITSKGEDILIICQSISQESGEKQQIYVIGKIV